MPKFIQLTYRIGGQVFVRADSILKMIPIEHPEGGVFTEVYLPREDYIELVIETPEEILKLINGTDTPPTGSDFEAK